MRQPERLDESAQSARDSQRSSAQQRQGEEGNQCQLEEREDATKNEEGKAAQETKKEEEAVNRDEAYCRFCWVNDHTIENPLISSCQCSGGVKFVHFLCLRQWI